MPILAVGCISRLACAQDDGHGMVCESGIALRCNNKKLPRSPRTMRLARPNDPVRSSIHAGTPAQSVCLIRAVAMICSGLHTDAAALLHNGIIEVGRDEPMQCQGHLRVVG